MTYLDILADDLKASVAHNVEVTSLDIDAVLEFLEQEDLLNKKGKELRISFEARYIADDPIQESEED